VTAFVDEIAVELVGHEIDRLTILLDEFLAFARPRLQCSYPLWVKHLDVALSPLGSRVARILDHAGPALCMPASRKACASGPAFT
jgi:hypothetical protein